MNRHEARLHVIFALYQHLLLNKDLNECFLDNFETDNEIVLALKEDIKNNVDIYIDEINKHLKRWSFDRLSFIDQAILLEACSEIKLNLNNKNIVIDEAIIIAKEYSDDDSYKYINGVLDNLWKQ
ncbi:MAG: transcription antitermination protein NusB [Erysipelotrichaceae bacterium]|nr:transcription antitermination protein NusB [Erysipelotrichaceae bacterium]